MWWRKSIGRWGGSSKPFGTPRSKRKRWSCLPATTVHGLCSVRMAGPQNRFEVKRPRPGKVASAFPAIFHWPGQIAPGVVDGIGANLDLYAHVCIIGWRKRTERQARLHFPGFSGHATARQTKPADYLGLPPQRISIGTLQTAYTNETTDRPHRSGGRSLA